SRNQASPTPPRARPRRRADANHPCPTSPPQTIAPYRGFERRWGRCLQERSNGVVHLVTIYRSRPRGERTPAPATSLWTAGTRSKYDARDDHPYLSCSEGIECAARPVAAGAVHFHFPPGNAGRVDGISAGRKSQAGESPSPLAVARGPGAGPALGRRHRRPGDVDARLERREDGP